MKGCPMEGVPTKVVPHRCSAKGECPAESGSLRKEGVSQGWMLRQGWMSRQRWLSLKEWMSC